MNISSRFCLITVILFLLSVSIIIAQQITLNIADVYGESALLRLEGEKTFLVDSIRTNNQGIFNIPALNLNLHAGFYRLSIDKNHWLDFLYDGKDVELKTDIKNIFDSLTVIKSESNKLYYPFIKLNKTYKTKSELLKLILARYPNDDEYYNQTLKRLLELQSEYSEFVNNTSQKEPVSFIARYVKSAQLPVVDISIPIEKQLPYLKLHALDNVDFNNASLINSDLFSNKSIEYLTYYSNPQLPRELLEKEFMGAVDTILNKAKVNILVYQHITEYLIDGFKKFGFDKIIDYIVENYVIADDLCLDEKLENSIQKRIDQSKNLAVGVTAPNIISSDTSGNKFDLSNIHFDKTLLIFYTSWCPHCQEVLPEISKLYNAKGIKNLEIVAVSLDEKKEDWLKFVKENNLNWINVSDLHGWDGAAANDYSIYATPTMFLLDKERKIIAKPLTINELKEWLY